MPPTIAWDPHKEAFKINTYGNQALVLAIKQVPGREFDSETRAWFIPPRSEVITPLKNLSTLYALKIQEDAKRKLIEIEITEETNQAMGRAVSFPLARMPEGLGLELKPWQTIPIAQARLHRSLFITDYMGLGKTIEALAVLQDRGYFPAVVVCPGGLKINWMKETLRVLPGRPVCILDREHELTEAMVYIVSYDLLNDWLPFLLGIGLQGLVLDESHYIKNYKAQRTKAAQNLAKYIPHKILLTGTPTPNGKPIELVPQLGAMNWLNDLGGFWPFVTRYCDAHQVDIRGRKIWDMTGANHLGELNERLFKLGMIRRDYSEVMGSEVPEPYTVWLDLDNRPDYDLAEQDFINWLRNQGKVITGKDKGLALIQLSALRQLSAYGKLNALSDWLQNILENTREKILVFSHHVKIAQAIGEAFDYPVITGAENPGERMKIIEDFNQNPETRLLSATIGAAGTGYNITGARHVVMIELPWTPGEFDQAIARVNRLGHQGPVFVWLALASDTVDQTMFDLLGHKRLSIDELIGSFHRKGQNEPPSDKPDSLYP